MHIVQLLAKFTVLVKDIFLPSHMQSTEFLFMHYFDTAHEFYHNTFRAFWFHSHVNSILPRAKRLRSTCIPNACSCVCVYVYLPILRLFVSRRVKIAFELNRYINLHVIIKPISSWIVLTVAMLLSDAALKFSNTSTYTQTPSCCYQLRL